MKQKVESHPDFVKDDASPGGIVNTNHAEWLKRQKEKNRYKQDQASTIRMEAMEDRINNINSDISDIKELLRTLINGNANS